MKTAFRPPKLNPLVVNSVKALLPWMMASPSFAMRTAFEPEDLKLLSQYKNQRLLLLPNHPTSEDPLVMMDLSSHLHQTFNYVAAREVFELYNGFNGWLLQRCGVYSVIRGKADRDSFRTTRQLLAEGNRPLVIFIEGEISNENDQLIPFEAGVLQLAFWALEDIKNANKESESIPELPMATVTIKYFYDDGVEAAVDKALIHLEKTTGMPVQEGKNPYERMRALGQMILNVHERSLNIHSKADDSIAARVERVKERLLGQMEHYLDLKPSQDISYLDRIRAVRNRIDTLVYSYEDTDEFSDYEKHKLELRQKTFSSFYRHLTSLVNFMTFQEGRVIEREDRSYAPDLFQPERMMELLHRIEKEILGSVATHHPRTARVKLGPIHNLSDYFPEYETNKKATVSKLAHILEANTAICLQQLKMAFSKS